MKPVIVLGYGIRSAGADPSKLLELGIPVLSSWQAADLVDNNHPMYFGRPGIYGHRTANHIFYTADKIIAVGNRMSPWQVGIGGLREGQSLHMIDCDPDEINRYPEATFSIGNIDDDINRLKDGFDAEWVEQCNKWRDQYPWIEAAHNDANGYMNSYRIVDQMQRYFRKDEVIAVDVGGVMCPIFQVIKFKPPQRVMTSGGLGEMGCGLPAAIGASFARNKGEVICFVGDGGIMLNIQELQTIIHHKLPIKIVVFENGGYAMIKRTQRNLSMKYTGVHKESGVSFPDFRRLAHALGMNACDVYKWDEFYRAVPQMFDAKEPSMVVFHLDPEQKFVPKLEPIMHPDGRIESAQFNRMSPLL